MGGAVGRDWGVGVELLTAARHYKRLFSPDAARREDRAVWRGILGQFLLI